MKWHSTNCEVCGGRIEVKGKGGGKPRYCSTECADDYRIGPGYVNLKRADVLLRSAWKLTEAMA